MSRHLWIKSCLCLMALLACKPRLQRTESSLTGIRSDTLEQKHKHLSPRYSRLSAAHEIRASLFFTFANGKWRIGDYTHEDAKKFQTPDPKVRDQKMWDTTSERSIKWDQATRSLNDVQRWFFDTQSNRGLYVCIQGRKRWLKPETPHYISEIRCQGPDFKGGRATWRIRFHLSSPIFGAPFLGQAMASEHITMLNGHFYTKDARRAAVAGDQFSRVYGPAIEEFKRNIDDGSHSYRIVVFNGCGSETIEDQVFEAAKKRGVDEGLHMVANRGYSNYGLFDDQIKSFLKGLGEKQTWAKLLKSFSYRVGKYDKSIPVFRNNQELTQSDRDEKEG